MLRTFFALAALFALAAALPSSAFGQGAVAGVAVDAKGVLSNRTFDDPGFRLTKQKIAAAKAGLDQKLGRQSPLRKVSLNRLQAAIDDQLAQGRPPSDDMKYLAG